MTKTLALIKILYGKELDKISVANLYYEFFPDMVDEKRQSYVDRNKFISEKALQKQIYAEVGSIMVQGRFFVVNRDKTPYLYSLAEQGVEKYKEYWENPDQDQEQIVMVVDNGIGYVYLLRSRVHEKTYKMGVTIDIDQRIKSLKIDKRYGSYDLELVSCVRLKNYYTVEQVLHKYFEDFRLCKKNDLFVDTELFKATGDVDMEKEFQNFMRMNYIEHPRLKNDVLDYKNC